MRIVLSSWFGLDDRETRFFASALRVTALPALGLLFYFAHGLLADRFMDLSALPDRNARHALLLLGALMAPAIAASAFAFPIAAIFPRYPVGASLFIGFPSLKVSFGHALDAVDGPYWTASSVIAIMGIALLLPLAARYANSLSGSSRTCRKSA